MPIKTFRHKGLKRLYEAGNTSGIPPRLADKIRDMLATIDTADSVSEIGLFPGWRLHPLKGDLAGRWSLTVSGNWRIVFRFGEGDAFELDLLDYH